MVTASKNRAKQGKRLCPVFVEITDCSAGRGSHTVNPTGFLGRCLP